MSKKASAAKGQQNSLFSYFDKSPAPKLKTEISDKQDSNGSPSNNKKRQEDQSSQGSTSKFFGGSSNNKTTLNSDSTPSSPLSRFVAKSIASPSSSQTTKKETISPKNENEPTRKSKLETVESDPKKKNSVKVSKNTAETKKNDSVAGLLDGITPDMLEMDFEDEIVQKKPASKKRKVIDDSFDAESDKEEEKEVSDVSEDEIKEPKSKVKSKSKAKPSKSTKSTKSKTTKSPKKSTNSNENLTTAQKKKADKDEAFIKKNEERYAFLVDVRDANLKRPGDEGYDPRTLHIPQGQYLGMTAFERQYWDIKKNLWDTIVFFKKGKFYELYENDAEIARQKLDLKVSERVNMKMAGVPENRYDDWAAKLVNMSYKVARVDQMETAVGKEKRMKNKTKKKEDDIIKRELTKIYTVGTLVDENIIRDSHSAFLLAIKELYNAPKNDSVNENLGLGSGKVHYGICLVDSATAEFTLGEFEDDKQRTQLETLLLQTKPREVLYEKGNLSTRSTIVIKKNLLNPLMSGRVPKTEFLDMETTIARINVGNYFKKEGEEKQVWPKVLEQFKNKQLVMSAFGACLQYFQELKLDNELISLKNFKVYDPYTQETKSLVIDGQSLFNLEIFHNTKDQGSQGTLLKLLDHTCTNFGKRVFKKWLCYPLLKASDINDRLDAVEDLMENVEWRKEIQMRFNKLPDLERMISRIHAGSSKLSDFLDVIEAFEICLLIIKEFEAINDNFKSSRLKSLTTIGDEFPDLEPALKSFDKMFSREKAKETNTIIPFEGFEPEYDKSVKAIALIEKTLDDHLKEVRKHMNDKTISYKHIGRTPYQLEMPTARAGDVPRDYDLTSQTKTKNRYYSPTIKKLTKELEFEKDNLEVVRRTLLRKVYNHFDQHYLDWLKAISCIAEIDALMSLSISSSSPNMCRPKFYDIEEDEEMEDQNAMETDEPKYKHPYLEVKQMRHPCVIPKIGSEFIPNDLNLGKDQPSSLILTGPNMGGKSTLLRQTCILVIMAQLGCYVTGEECTMTPVDRIFTRIGANDDIIGGQSTFMVELNETSTIMKHATDKSLIILDELGRGTSTYDGYSIAYSVLDFLVSKLNCRVMFSTHYHKLTDEFENNKKVSLYHMDCLVEEDAKEVVFLYTLAEGVCPKSYGMNVAKMAGIPAAIVDRAEKISDQFEKATQNNYKPQFSNVGGQKSDVDSFLTLFRTLGQKKLQYKSVLDVWNAAKVQH